MLTYLCRSNSEKATSTLYRVYIPVSGAVGINYRPWAKMTNIIIV